jgi:stage II sporulation protein R
MPAERSFPEGRSLVLKLTAVLLILISALGWLMAKKESRTAAQGLIRFHVVANSDGPGDQLLKRAVRDRLLVLMSPKLKPARSAAEARKIVQDNLPLIEAEAIKVLEDQGQLAPVQARLGSYPFPTKAYGSLVLPAGSYEALRVTIGRGQGANWWCVLFPPLCFVDISKGAVALGETSGGPNVNSRLDSRLETIPAGPGEQIRVRLKIGELLDRFRLAETRPPEREKVTAASSGDDRSMDKGEAVDQGKP